MNRRGFFQRIAGFACGLLGIKSLPEEKATYSASSPSASTSCGTRRSGTTEIKLKYKGPTLCSGDFFQHIRLNEPIYGKVVSMVEFQGKLFIATERDGIYVIEHDIYRDFIEMELDNAEAFHFFKDETEKINNLMFINRCRQVLDMPLIRKDVLT
ncbi:MAG: hypothetical protein JSW18_05655 [Candidatus Omnitrophota bacterium]|nr:MAG: hypothetical protein JSW18_05655 [Candidatus Omnitrophota bacterium]